MGERPSQRPLPSHYTAGRISQYNMPSRPQQPLSQHPQQQTAQQAHYYSSWLSAATRQQQQMLGTTPYYQGGVPVTLTTTTGTSSTPLGASALFLNCSPSQLQQTSSSSSSSRYPYHPQQPLHPSSCQPLQIEATSTTSQPAAAHLSAFSPAAATQQISPQNPYLQAAASSTQLIVTPPHTMHSGHSAAAVSPGSLSALALAAPAAPAANNNSNNTQTCINQLILQQQQALMQQQQQLLMLQLQRSGDTSPAQATRSTATKSSQVVSVPINPTPIVVEPDEATAIDAPKTEHMEDTQKADSPSSTAPVTSEAKPEVTKAVSSSSTTPVTSEVKPEETEDTKTDLSTSTTPLITEVKSHATDEYEKDSKTEIKEDLDFKVDGKKEELSQGKDDTKVEDSIPILGSIIGRYSPLQTEVKTEDQAGKVYLDIADDPLATIDVSDDDNPGDKTTTHQTARKRGRGRPKKTINPKAAAKDKDKNDLTESKIAKSVAKKSTSKKKTKNNTAKKSTSPKKRINTRLRNSRRTFSSDSVEIMHVVQSDVDVKECSVQLQNLNAREIGKIIGRLKSSYMMEDEEEEEDAFDDDRDTDYVPEIPEHETELTPPSKKVKSKKTQKVKSSSNESSSNDTNSQTDYSSGTGNDSSSGVDNLSRTSNDSSSQVDNFSRINDDSSSRTDNISRINEDSSFLTDNSNRISNASSSRTDNSTRKRDDSSSRMENSSRIHDDLGSQIGNSSRSSNDSYSRTDNFSRSSNDVSARTDNASSLCSSAALQEKQCSERREEYLGFRQCVEGIGSITVPVSIVPSKNHVEKPRVSTLTVKTSEGEHKLNVIYKKLGEYVVPQCVSCSFSNLDVKELFLHRVQGHADIDDEDEIDKPDSLLYLRCNHCDFVTINRVRMWFHFRFFHAISNALKPFSLSVLKKQMNSKQNSRCKITGKKYRCPYPACRDERGTDGLCVNPAKVIIHMANVHTTKKDGEPIIDHLTDYDFIFEGYMVLVEENLNSTKQVLVCSLCAEAVHTSVYEMNMHLYSMHMMKYLLYECADTKECRMQYVNSLKMKNHCRYEHLGESHECRVTAVTSLGDNATEDPQFIYNTGRLIIDSLPQKRKKLNSEVISDAPTKKQKCMSIKGAEAKPKSVTKRQKYISIEEAEARPKSVTVTSAPTVRQKYTSVKEAEAKPTSVTLLSDDDDDNDGCVVTEKNESRNNECKVGDNISDRREKIDSAADDSNDSDVEIVDHIVSIQSKPKMVDWCFQTLPYDIDKEMRPELLRPITLSDSDEETPNVECGTSTEIISSTSIETMLSRPESSSIPPRHNLTQSKSTKAKSHIMTLTKRPVTDGNQSSAVNLPQAMVNPSQQQQQQQQRQTTLIGSNTLQSHSYRLKQPEHRDAPTHQQLQHCPQQRQASISYMEQQQTKSPFITISQSGQQQRDVASSPLYLQQRQPSTTTNDKAQSSSPLQQPQPQVLHFQSCALQPAPVCSTGFVKPKPQSSTCSSTTSLAEADTTSIDIIDLDDDDDGDDNTKINSSVKQCEADKNIERKQSSPRLRSKVLEYLPSQF